MAEITTSRGDVVQDAMMLLIFSIPFAFETEAPPNLYTCMLFDLKQARRLLI